MANSNPVKFAYIKSSSIDTKIQGKILDEWDNIITSDTHEQVFINDKLEKVTVKSRIYTFTSEAEALDKLNKNTDTYSGQPISIWNDTDKEYVSYIVNYDSTANRYTIKPVGSGGTSSGSSDVATEADILSMFA